MTDTIVSVATAAGEGGVAIVRMSGDEAAAIFEQAFRPRKRRPPFESHRLMLGHVLDANGEPIDEAMGVIMRAPNSYTREDVCEIHTHGGSVAASMVVRRLIQLGARPAEAGEFTRRAFTNGRIDLMQAEAVMGVIGAQSAAALRAERRQLSGGQSQFIREAQEDLTGLLAGLEAHIDYPDEIDEDEALEGLNDGLAKLIDKLEKAIDERGARIVREGLHVALCGRPNAGKSTLFNALLGEERAIVTDIPGTTRDVLEGSFSLDGVRVILLDTAGLRESGDAVEQIGVERAKAALEKADVALLLVDASTAMTQDERELLAMETPCPCAVL
ncbi:MAG: tRNA uridine-5-carboxymethylaminomethyl(34) synthesis GTPase MnmE, partial [Clostridia bacterium]|nr:tRNA uridine-5-carboxymethylaminomethyl(34) synthesis GTPase MnmE [Clostridia bacterium]